MKLKIDFVNIVLVVAILFLLLLWLVSCNPVKQVINDKAKLDKVLGFDGESPIAKTKAEDAKLKTYDDDVQEIMSKKTPALDEDDDLNYFTSLAN